MRKRITMRSALKHYILAAGLTLPFLLLTSDGAAAQGRSGGGGVSVEFTAEISFSLGDRDLIQAHYTSNPNPDAKALPPGTRKNLARGKSMPPGIAKRFPPDALRSSLSIPERYHVIEVGLDVFLVEVATGIIHDVLMDVIR